MKKKELSAEEGLRKLAFGSVSDAVRLATGEKFDAKGLKKLDLFCVESIKYTDKGVEMKFYDRCKALSMLLSLGGGETQEGLLELFRNLGEREADA